MAPLPNEASSSKPARPLPTTISYFGNSHNFQILDSHFTEVHGDQVINETSNRATHDSQERFPAPNCYKGTRVNIISDILSWVGDLGRTHRILWLNGAPGVGKSAISQTIAERCAQAKRLAGSFFFSSESEDRRTAQRFIITLAYQMSVVIPDIKAEVENEIKFDPRVLSTSLDHQLERLIVRPLSRFSDFPPMVIIVDALDESDLAGQNTILELIPALLSGLPHSFCLLITSRPETNIREAFDGDLRGLCRRTTLDQRYKPEKDIEIFLRSKLSEISWRRGPRDQTSHSWPAEDDIQLLVDACSGQFLCAATITRYIKDGPHRPEVMLKNLLNSTGSKHAALTPLDSLYVRILSTCSQPSHFPSIIGFVIVSSCNIKFIEGLIELNRGDVAHYLREFNSVLYIPRESDKNQTIRIRHPSFREFLLDSSRSGSFSIDPKKEHARVATSMLNIQSRSNVDELLLLTSLEYWGLHCSQAVLTDKLLKALQNFKLQKWLMRSNNPAHSHITNDLEDVMSWMLKVNHPSLNVVHANWIQICYDFFYSELEASSLGTLSIDVFLALAVTATMARHLQLDPSVACDILEPFMTNSKTLWFSLDSRIGLTSPYEPSSAEYRNLARRFYHDTLNTGSKIQTMIPLDVRQLKSSDGTVLPRFNLDYIDTFNRFKLNPATCHTHFALACLSYMNRRRTYDELSIRSSYREVQAYTYATNYWANHVANSIPTPALMANLKDFIHRQHPFPEGNEKLTIVISWLKGLTNPPLALISCWESASRREYCSDMFRDHDD